MDHPFFADHISEIHEADTLYDSQFSSRILEQQNWYQQQRSFTKSVLSSWGLAVGELPYSRDNEATVRCLAELVGYRQKELQFRSRTKEELGALQFQCDKYRSFMEQGQRTIEEHIKRIGCLENELTNLRAKSKKSDMQTKRERDEDRKMISMLRNKNEQILHEIKKKEQETVRVKEQMKKNIGEKTPTKNSFEVFQNIGNRSPSKEKQAVDDKYIFLLERNQRELSLAVKENALLREKLFQIRESLVKFNIWIDKQIFGEQIEESTETPRAYNHKFYVNHNLLFKKESLTEELEQLLEVTRDGLIQVREIFRGNRSPPKKIVAEAIQADEPRELNFRKKGSMRPEIKTERTIKNQFSKNERENKNSRTSINKKVESISSENQTPKSMKQSPTQQIQSEVNIKHFSSKAINRAPPQQVRKVGAIITKPISTPLAVGKKSKQMLQDSKKQAPFEDELLCEMSEGHDSSIISHISIEQMGKSRFDKWDILYQEGQ